MTRRYRKMNIEEFERHTIEESEDTIKDNAHKYATPGCRCEQIYIVVAREAVKELFNSYRDRINKGLKEGVSIGGMLQEMADKIRWQIPVTQEKKIKQGIEERVKALPTDETLIELAKEHITNKKYLTKFEKKIEELYK
jgi:hypothetical protein